ncbi:Uncharacterised protein [Vibrio cholerae]|nr:Uncharacterised protein [Vibrio cholerae]
MTSFFSSARKPPTYTTPGATLYLAGSACWVTSKP